jgi:hypothetical protein
MTAKPKNPPPSPYDQNFWNFWSDGKAEYCSYTLQGGEATTVLRLDGARVMHLTVRKSAKSRSEMLDVALPLEPVSGRPAGAVAAASFSRQDEAGHSWAQATFGSRRSFFTRHASGQPDLNQVLDHSPPGVSADGLLLWARRIAWPRIKEDARFDSEVINSLSSAGRQEHPMGTFSRSARTASFVSNSGYRISFEVHPALPHYVKGWESSDGERASLIGCERR